MTDRELRRLSRAALIELLILQMEENQKLEEELSVLRMKVAGDEFDSETPKPAAAQRSEQGQRPEPAAKPRTEQPVPVALSERDLAILQGSSPEPSARRSQGKAKDPFWEALSAFRENNH